MFCSHESLTVLKDSNTEKAEPDVLEYQEN